MGGALPILNGVTIVGAIGVAGASRPEQDVLCCRAGPGHWSDVGEAWGKALASAGRKISLARSN